MVKKKSAICAFMKEHIVLAILFVISCLLLFLTSGIAVEVPEGLYTNIAKLIDVFTGAYVTGILLLLAVEEIPREKSRQKAMKTVYPIIQSLYGDINDLTEMLRISSGGSNLDELCFNNRTVSIHIDRHNSSGMDCYYNLLDSSTAKAQEINRLISDFSSTPLSRDCDDELLKVTSEIKANRTIAILLPRPDTFGAIGGLSKANELLLHSLDVIEGLYPNLGRSVYAKMSPEERQNAEEIRKALKPIADEDYIKAYVEAMRRDPI